MANENYEPSDVEDAVIEVLREGRANPLLLRERTGYDKGTLNTALSNLTSAGWIRRVTRGLYEFVEDPRDSQEPETDPIEDALTGWSHGRGEEKQQASEQVARASLEWLREHGRSVQKSDVPLDELQDSDPLGRKTNTLWKKVIKPAWDHAADGEHIDKPHSRAYRWVGRSE